MNLTIRQLGPGDADVFERALAIYREAIDPSEQRREAELRAALGRGDYCILVAARAGEVVGLAIAFLPAGEDFWLLEYVATAASERGRGTGEMLVREAAALVGQGRTGLVEVDAGLDGPETIAARRQRFYRRLGCRKIDGLQYLLPLRTHGEPPPMVLFALAPETVASIPTATVERWLQVIYVQVYGQRADDPRIARMTQDLSSDAPLT